MNRAKGFGDSDTFVSRLWVVFLGLIFTVPAVPALAQDAAPPAGDPAAAPPARAVRLSSVEGQVELSQGNQILAQQAMANTPLFEGSQLATSDDGRAEVQFEDGSVARISPNSSMTLATLRQQGGRSETELVLNSGLGYFEIQGNSEADQMHVRFGDNVVTASGFTVLRLNLDDAPGEVAVFSGNAHLEGPSSLALDLHGGESVKLNSSDPGNYMLAESIDPDSWDAWNSDRDQALTAEEANRTAATNGVPNSNNPAWNDLDSNGNWYNVPGQGYVWSPYEAQSGGWDPYGCGNWVWEPGYGYVWVSCESWGYMPYAFGTWNYYDGFGWGWCPGLAGPWWGLGFWNFNIGATPVHYLPPHRPHGGPVHPVGGPIHPGGRYQPFPVMTVNRIRTVNTPMPMHPRTGSALISGSSVAPLRAVAPRPIYGHAASSGVLRSPVPYGGTGAGTTNPGVRHGFVQGSSPYPGVRPPSAGPTMPAVPAQSHYTPFYGSPGFHPTPSPAPHGSYSGGYAAPRSNVGPAPAPRAGGGSFGGGVSHGGGAVGAGGGGGHAGAGTGGGGGHH